MFLRNFYSYSAKRSSSLQSRKTETPAWQQVEEKERLGENARKECPRKWDEGGGDRQWTGEKEIAEHLTRGGSQEWGGRKKELGQPSGKGSRLGQWGEGRKNLDNLQEKEAAWGNEGKEERTWTTFRKRKPPGAVRERMKATWECYDEEDEDKDERPRVHQGKAKQQNVAHGVGFVPASAWMPRCTYHRPPARAARRVGPLSNITHLKYVYLVS